MPMLAKPPRSAQADFSSSVAELNEALEGGYKENQDLIIDLMKGFAHGSMVVHWFIQNLCQSDYIRRMRGAQSFYLVDSKAFSMRLSLWFPDNKLPEKVAVRYDKYFSVGVLHNHNFDFFTVGVYGPGYTSDFYVNNEDLSKKEVGDVIDLEKAWSMKLAQGHSMYVPRGDQFHVQHAPDSMSMSLNVIPNQPRKPTDKQFIMKNDMKTIEHVVYPDSYKF